MFVSFIDVFEHLACLKERTSRALEAVLWIQDSAPANAAAQIQVPSSLLLKGLSSTSLQQQDRPSHHPQRAGSPSARSHPWEKAKDSRLDAVSKGWISQSPELFLLLRPPFALFWRPN